MFYDGSTLFRCSVQSAKLRASARAGYFLLVLAGAFASAQDNTLLTGVVRDLASAPVAKVSITLGSLERVLQGETAEDGAFRFSSVPADTYDIAFTAPGFVTQKFSI